MPEYSSHRAIQSNIINKNEIHEKKKKKLPPKSVKEGPTTYSISENSSSPNDTCSSSSMMWMIMWAMENDTEISF